MAFYEYRFTMVFRPEQMTRGERLIADEQAARMVHEVADLGRAIRRGVRRLASSPGATRSLSTPPLRRTSSK